MPFVLLGPVATKTVFGADRVEVGIVAVLEVDVVGVGVQSPAAMLQHGADLIGLGQGRLRRHQNLRVRNVEDGAGRNDAAFGPLRVDRPTALEVVTGGDIREPVVVVDIMMDKRGATDANRRLVTGSVEATPPRQPTVFPLSWY